MPKNVEIERKFLVTSDSYKQQSVAHHEICQGYLCVEPGKTIRVRIADDRAYLTIKSGARPGGLARFEWEREIDPSDAKELMALCMEKRILKTRWIVPAEAVTGDGLPVTGKPLKWEVDEFHGHKEGLVVAEIELEDEAQTFLKPDFIGQEVTGDHRYSNAYMITE